MKLDVQMVTKRVSFERWRELYHSDDFSERLVRSAKMRARQVVEHDHLADGRERRKVKIVPDVNLPKVARKVLGNAEVAYFEVTVYDPSTRTARLDIESDAGDRVRVGGDVRYLVDDDQVTVDFRGGVSVDVFGAGKLIERYIASEVKKRYTAMEQLLQSMVDDSR